MRALTLIGNFEVEKWNLELKLRNSKLELQKILKSFETFTLEFGLFLKLGDITWFIK